MFNSVEHFVLIHWLSYLSATQRFVREGDWYTGVDIWNGMVTIRRFDNLMAFWPGMQTLIGESSPCSYQGHI